MPIVSSRGVDYRNLKELLSGKQWQQADVETYRVMCDAVRKSTFSGLSLEDIQNFPCEDLQIVDRLWREHSNDRYGFSIQKQLFEEEGEDSDAFFRRIGWFRNGIWIAYADVKWPIDKAPIGHLPIGGRGGLFGNIGDIAGDDGLLGYIKTSYAIADSAFRDLFNRGGFDRFFDRLKAEATINNSGFAMCWRRPRIALIARMQECNFSQMD
jgi:GUN4-like